MRVGLIVRGEDRGLGSLGRDWYDNLRPDKTLLLIPAGVRRHGLTTHQEWYPDATLVRFDGNLNERICREWLVDLDCVVSFETFYDWRFCNWAAQAHVATVCMAMPEWWRPQWADFTKWWAPTSWRLNELPRGTPVVPVPMTAPNREKPQRTADRPFRWLHVGGARLPDEQMHADRNGTLALLEACRYLEAPQEVVVRTQSPGLECDLPNVTIRYESLASRWDLYSDVDAVVQPRRYAGLSLPVLEAFACGLPVVMTDMSPQNTDWPVQTVQTTPGPAHRIYGADIATGDADPHALAALMDSWATNPAEVEAWRDKTAVYARENSWEQRLPQIRAELALVAG